VLPVALLVLLVAAAAGYFAVEVIADWGGQVLG
jgi:hypothetical protein